MASARKTKEPTRARGCSKCPHHQGKEVIFICENCDGVLICATCVATNHRTHAVKEICEVIPELKVKVQDFVNKTERNDMPKVKSEIKSLDKEISKNKKQFSEIVVKIQTQNSLVKHELDKITNTLVMLCRDIENQNNEILKKHKAELRSRKKELGAHLQELKDTVQLGTGTQLYDISKEIPYDTSLPNLPSLQGAVFSTASVLLDQLEKFLGQLSTTTEGSQQPQVRLASAIIEGNARKKRQSSKRYSKSQKLQLFTYKLSAEYTSDVFVNQIRTTTENHALLCNNSGDIQRLGQAGEIEKMKMEVSTEDFCVSPFTGDIWFCSNNDNSVRKVTGDNTSIVMFNTDSGPISICVSTDGNILLGIRQQLRKYSHNGEILCKSKEVKSVPEVKFPHRISQCPITKNFAVVDWDSKDCGGSGKPNVSIFSEELQLLCKYNGKDAKSFSPFDVCYNEAGDVFIADCDNKAIQRISGKGEFIQTVYIDNDKPVTALGVRSSAEIWAVLDWETVAILRKH